MTWIVTGTGASRFSLVDPSARDVSPSDIIMSLSRTPRFRGLGMHFFSVAQHAVLVGYLMWINSGVTTLKELLAHPIKVQQGDWASHLMRVALLHDAAKVYMSDLPTPLESLLPDYTALENRIEPLCYGRFGVEATDMDLKRVELADAQATLMERDLLFPDNLRNWEWEHLHPGYSVPDFFSHAWSSDEAAPRFAQTFAQYFPEVTGHVH